MKINGQIIATFICQFLIILSSFAQENNNIEGPPFNFFFQDTTVPEGGTACMDVVVENITNVSSFQFGLNFDGSKFNFVDIMAIELDSSNLLAAQPFNYGPSNTILTVLYTNFTANGVTLPDASVAFSLCFEAIGEEGDTSLVLPRDTIANGQPTQLFIPDGTAFLIPEFNLVPATLTIGEGNSPIECSDICFEIGTTWIYQGNDITLNRDSIICGDIWYGMSDLGFCARSVQDFFLRKDEEAIWMHDPVANFSSILYDFTKQAGESWEIIFPNGMPSHTVLVDSVTTRVLNGLSIQVQHVSSDPYTSSYDFNGEIYEGIGSSHYLFPTGNLCDGGPNGLICYSTEGEEFSIDMDRPCLPTSVGELRVLNNVSLYPNPVQDQLHLDTPEQDWNYQILNLQGQQMMQGQYRDYIGVEQLPSGVYFLQLQSGAEIYQAQKFIKL